MLQRVLRGRIVFTPEGAGYLFTAPTRFDKLFTGIMAPMPAFLAGETATGAAHIPPQDTFDADYGRLLEQAAQGCVKWGGVPNVRELEPDHGVAAAG